MKKKLQIIGLVLSLAIMASPSSFAQPVPSWQVDSMLHKLGNPNIQYSFNFNLVFTELDPNYTTLTPHPLKDVDDVDLEKKLTGKNTDAWVYERLFYKANADNDFELAEKYFMKAATNFEALMADDLFNTYVVQKFIDLLLVGGRINAAEQIINYALDMFSDNVNFHQQKVMLHSAYKSEFEKGDRLLHEAIEKFPDNPELRSLDMIRGFRVEMMQNNGKIVNEEAVIGSMLEFSKRKPGSLLYDFTGRYAKAFMIFNLVTLSAMANEDLNLDRDEILTSKQRDFLNENIEYIKKLQNDKKISDHFAHMHLAMQYFCLGDKEKTLHHLREQLKYSHPNQKDQALESILLMEIGFEKDDEKRLAILKKSIESMPTPREMTSIASLYLEIGLLDSAHQIIETTITKFPTYTMAWLMASKIMLHKKHIEKAQTYLAKAKRMNADKIYLFLLETIVKAITEGKEQALEHLKPLLDAEPDNDKALEIKKVLTGS